MDNKIESSFQNAALQMNELFQAATAETVAAPAAPATGAASTMLAVNDSVDHAGADAGSGVLMTDYQRFDTGNQHLDDQLLLARTGGPAAAATQGKRGEPTMTATGQYSAGDHSCFVLRFATHGF